MAAVTRMKGRGSSRKETAGYKASQKNKITHNPARSSNVPEIPIGALNGKRQGGLRVTAGEGNSVELSPSEEVYL